MQSLEKKGKSILKTLNDSGYEAFFVGGYVRDKLLNRPTKDIDITTNATPDTVHSLFKKTVLTGKAFGTVTVIIDNMPFEVTTYRHDMQYDNHRHPTEIKFASTLKEDLSRRDFTINQLVMDFLGNVIDHFEGKKDLSNQLIKTIGNPLKRFEEDALRILRAFRFASTLGFKIETETLEAIKDKVSNIRKISIERVQDELFLLLDGPFKPYVIEKMIETNTHKALHLKTGFKALLKLKTSDYNAIEACVLMQDETPFPYDKYHLSNKVKKKIETIQTIHQKTFNASFNSYVVFNYEMDDLLSANHVNILKGGIDQSSDIKRLKENLTIKDIKALAFKGDDIKKTLDLDSYRQISVILDELLKSVLDKSVDNTYQDLKKRAKQILAYLKDSEENGKI